METTAKGRRSKRVKKINKDETAPIDDQLVATKTKPKMVKKAELELMLKAEELKVVKLEEELKKNEESMKELEALKAKIEILTGEKKAIEKKLIDVEAENEILLNTNNSLKVKWQQRNPSGPKVLRTSW